MIGEPHPISTGLLIDFSNSGCRSEHPLGGITPTVKGETGARAPVCSHGHTALMSQPN